MKYIVWLTYCISDQLKHFTPSLLQVRIYIFLQKRETEIPDYDYFCIVL